MGYEIIRADTNKIWLVDWGVVYQILRSYEVYRQANQLYAPKMVPQEHGPDLLEADLPWSRIRQQAHHRASSQVEAWRKLMRKDAPVYAGMSLADTTPPRLDSDLAGPLAQMSPAPQHMLFDRDFVLRVIDDAIEGLHREGQGLKRTFRDKLSSTQNINMSRIRSSVDNWDKVISATKIVRDVSFQTVCIGAVVVGGPAGVALAAAGSGGKGAAKYQDTGNIGAATIEATGSFVTTVIPLGKAASGAKAMTGTANRIAEESVLVFIDGSFDVAGNLVEGDSMGLALTKAAVNFAGDKVASRALGAAPVKRLINRAAFPVSVRITRGIPSLPSIAPRGAAAGAIEIRRTHKYIQGSAAAFAKRVSKLSHDPIAEGLHSTLSAQNKPKERLLPAVTMCERSMGELAIVGPFSEA